MTHLRPIDSSNSSFHFNAHGTTMVYPDLPVPTQGLCYTRVDLHPRLTVRI